MSQTPSKTQQTEMSVCPGLSVVSVRGVHPMGERSAVLHTNLRVRDKNPGSTNKYTKFWWVDYR